MKHTIHKSVGKLIMGATLMLAIGGSFANAETIFLNFATEDNPIINAAGWQTIWYEQDPGNYGVFNQGNLVQTITTEIGEQTFTLEEGINAGTYIANNWHTVTGEGFYFNMDASRSFNLSGFTEGDQISVYAISAWKGNVNAGMVTIGSETTQALALDFASNNSGIPTIDNFTLINSTPFTVGADGLLTGSFNWNTVSGIEGDIGGLILVVTSVPEPSTWLLLAGGVSLLAVLRRRRR
ncbi:MAG: PEP-CTERM sorting domain-containing protein [Verrucomicrobiales bacterium]|jgi:hypothetical protein|nr:PEP-CTERM sorting domain-containing protein [Verrucomicrobiales bacterium]